MANQRGVLKALYLEDYEPDYNEYSIHLKRVLGTLGSSVDFERAETQPELISKMQTRPHLVFCDNDIDRDRNAGLKIISEMKDRFPDCLFCLITSHLIRVENLGAYVPNPEIIISKQHVGTQEYDRTLQLSFEKFLKRAPIVDLNLQFELQRNLPRHSGKKSLTRPELISLIEQCIDTGSATEETGVSSISLSTVSGGASGAGVYDMRVLRDSKPSKVPAILKISSRLYTIAEYKNYIQFVKWRLPYTWRVDVLGTGFTGEFGAICYSFAAGGGGAPTPVTKYIRDGRYEVIDRVIETILDSENQTWYAEAKPTGLDARHYFSGIRFYRNNKQREEFQGSFIDYLSENAKLNDIPCYEVDDKIVLDGSTYPRVNKLLFSHDWGAVTECVCHGDMNAGNVIYAGGDSNVVFIDFQRTGYWYLFRDFISFESSTRLEFRKEAPVGEDFNWWQRLKHLLELERQLYQQSWNCTDLPEYGSHVCKIRRAAHQNFPDEPFHIYVVANIVHSLWLFQKAAAWGEDKRLRLAAAVLAGCEFLATISRT